MFWSHRPAVREAFFDRDPELRRLGALFDALEAGAPEWLAILGPRKIGKSSLIVEAARRHARDSVRFVALDLMGELPLSPLFFRRYALLAAAALLDERLGLSLEALARQPEAWASELLESDVVASLPSTLRRDLARLPSLVLDAGGARLCLELPETLAAALELRLVIAVDEFQELGALDRRLAGFDPFPLMRSVWQQHERIAYVISGSGRSMLTTLITDRAAPFFQHFSVLELGPFAEPDAVELLMKCSPPESAIAPDLAARIARALGGWPFYLQAIGEELAHTGAPIDEPAFKAAFQALVFSETGRLSLYFRNEYERVVGRSSHLAAALDALAAGHSRVSELARAIAQPSGSTVRYIERLGDVVRRREDGSYAIEDPLFAAWVAWRKPGGTVVPMSLVGDEAEKGVAAHLARLGFELVYQSRGSRGAFDLLAIRGAAQLGVQVKRSALPLRFDRATWARMSADAKRFDWRWVVAAVEPGGVRVLDPAKAQRGKEVRLGEAAEIENLPAWLAGTG